MNFLVFFIRDKVATCCHAKTLFPSEVLGNFTTPKPSDNGESFDPLEFMGCFKCRTDHLISKRPHPINATRAARTKLSTVLERKGINALHTTCSKSYASNLI